MPKMNIAFAPARLRGPLSLRDRGLIALSRASNETSR